MAFKIFRKNCCGLDVHKTWIYACMGITDTNGRTEYKQARFSSFTKGLQKLADWLAKYDCNHYENERSVARRTAMGLDARFASKEEER